MFRRLLGRVFSCVLARPASLAHARLSGSSSFGSAAVPHLPNHTLRFPARRRKILEETYRDRKNQAPHALSLAGRELLQGSTTTISARMVERARVESLEAITTTDPHSGDALHRRYCSGATLDMADYAVSFRRNTGPRCHRLTEALFGASRPPQLMLFSIRGNTSLSQLLSAGLGLAILTGASTKFPPTPHFT